VSDGQLTRLVAIRHGETAWNVDTRIQGQLDIPLNDKGRWQAQQLGAAIAHEGIEAIYSSDLARAWQTAQALADACGLEPVAEPGLRERAFGIFEGHTFAEIEQRWPDGHQRWKRRDVDFGPEGGEVLHAFYARSVQTVERIARAHRGGTIALVAHGGVMDCLYRAAARLELRAPRTWQLGNAGINRLLHTDEGFVLIGWGDVAHLESGALDEVE
jgi:probable phosphoglycerate mutase